MEIEKVIGLISSLFIIIVFLIILNATLPRFAGFTSNRLPNHTLPSFAFQYWLLLVFVFAAGLMLFMWIRREE